MARETAYPTNGHSRQAIRIFDTNLLTLIRLLIGLFPILLTIHVAQVPSGFHQQIQHELSIPYPTRSWFGDGVFLEASKLIAALLIGFSRNPPFSFTLFGYYRPHIQTPYTTTHSLGLRVHCSAAVRSDGSEQSKAHSQGTNIADETRPEVKATPIKCRSPYGCWPLKVHNLGMPSGILLLATLLAGTCLQ